MPDVEQELCVLVVQELISSIARFWTISLAEDRHTMHGCDTRGIWKRSMKRTLKWTTPHGEKRKADHVRFFALCGR
jgi:hypothetical protein